MLFFKQPEFNASAEAQIHNSIRTLSNELNDPAAAVIPTSRHDLWKILCKFIHMIAMSVDMSRQYRFQQRFAFQPPDKFHGRRIGRSASADRGRKILRDGA